MLTSPDGPNPHHPYQDHWDKQRAENEKKPRFETLNDYHDYLSALTWSDQPKKEGSDEQNRSHRNPQVGD